MACRVNGGEAAMSDAYPKNSSFITIFAHRTDDYRKVARISAILFFRVSERYRAFFARTMAALDKTRRREAARIIHRYRHLMNDGKCSR
jgi:hypothetical protein